MKSLIFLCCVTIFLISTVVMGADQIAVVVNVENPNTVIKRNELENIFLGRSSRFPNGEASTPRDQASSPAKEAFYKLYFKLSLDQIHDFWIRETYRGGKRAPVFVDTRDDVSMKDWISKNRSGIGYLSRGVLDSSVKEVKIENE